MRKRRILATVFSFALSLALTASGCKQESRGGAPGPAADDTVGDILKPGFTAPPFSLPDSSGTVRSLRDYSGKIVLLNFWATWCVPCVAEMPALERLYKTLNKKGFEIVAISVDPAESADNVKRFISDRGITFPILFDPNLTVPERFGVQGFPESFFLDGGGRFISVIDPDTKRLRVRLISDRPWDSSEYISLVEQLLAKRSVTE